MNSGLSIIDGVSAWRDAQRAWQEAGCSAREAELLASSHTAGLVRLPGEVSVELLEAAEWEQLAVWPAGGDTYLAGSVAGFGALLKRWPAAAGIELATSLADALGVCWRPSRQMRWPGQAPAGWGRRPVVMGILNVTPDSFSDGGRFATLEAAVARGLEMVAEGAGIIDVGGESTRPGAPPVSAEEEAERVVPVISSLAKRVNVPISVDTYKAVVAEAAVAAGGSDHQRHLGSA